MQRSLARPALRQTELDHDCLEVRSLTQRRQAGPLAGEEQNERVRFFARLFRETDGVVVASQGRRRHGKRSWLHVLFPGALQQFLIARANLV